MVASSTAATPATMPTIMPVLLLLPPLLGALCAEASSAADGVPESRAKKGVPVPTYNASALVVGTPAVAEAEADTGPKGAIHQWSPAG